MNDPHVELLIYAVSHGDSITYDNAEPFSEETDEFTVMIENNIAHLYPRRHYATAEEAELAARDLVSQWNFESALGARDDAFKLEYARTCVIDRQPSPAPPGEVPLQISAVIIADFTADVRVTKTAIAYPRLPIGRRLAVDNRKVTLMMKHWMDYLYHRESLATMANFCLTVVENSHNVKGNRRKGAAQHYRIT